MNQFDLTNIEDSRSVTFNCDVALNTDGGVAVGFTIVGNNSEQFAQADREVRAFNVKANTLRVKNKKPLDAATDEGAMDVAIATEAHRAIYLKHCVVGWYGFTENGEAALFTPEAAARVLTARPAWAERLAMAIETEGNFVKG